MCPLENDNKSLSPRYAQGTYKAACTNADLSSFILVITCGNPNRSLLVPNGIWLPYAVSCYQYNCQFRLQCSEGYIQTVTHDITATCGQNSQWRKNSGDCKGTSFSA